MDKKIYQATIKNYFREFQNGNVNFNYSCYFENNKIAQIIDFLQSLSDEISKRNFNTIKFNCIINDFEFSHQILFNFIYADYLDDAPSNTDDETDTPFNNCNVDFYLDARLSFFSSVREYLLQIWDKYFLEDLKKYNAKDNKKPFENFNHDTCNYLVFQNLSGDNIDGFIAQDTDY